ncbi:histidine-type phosphatase [Sphingomonas sp. MA1305]|uniref:histidine-type phosphatase n=1 Tax=Sphingomonas sp. MA1305 TaxID=2479204 RepID=UPI0018DF2156|nr:histidine-type phosphatase [Sphingomonas sp. MA1305]MBI0475507.1 histidine-type phosphatase [Sphingomonas sp. MA1305]
MIFLLAVALASTPVASRLVPERVVMLMRHGVRAPIDGEAPADTRSAAPWPHWPVAAEQMTPHGLAALRIRGRDDRAWLAAAGLLSRRGCPADGEVRVHSNVSQRTIDSAAAFLAGFAPGCPIAVEHQREGTVDPLFEALRAGATDFDAATAVRAIERHTGGIARLAARHRGELTLLDHVLACPGTHDCTPPAPETVGATPDGRGIELSGAIRKASGTAQVLLLEYAQGLPMREVGWGRADAATIRRLGRLHAALFDVFTRPPYMAAHQAGPIGRAIIADLTAPHGSALSLYVGHDTNVTALAAALGVPLRTPDYADGDVAPGGALALTLLRDPVTGASYVRIRYRTQPLAALRHLTPGVTSTTIRMPGCATLCPLPRFVALLSRRLAPAR